MASWWDTLKAVVRGKGRGRTSVSQSGLTARVTLGTGTVKGASTPVVVGAINGGGAVDKP